MEKTTKILLMLALATAPTMVGCGDDDSTDEPSTGGDMETGGSESGGDMETGGSESGGDMETGGSESGGDMETGGMMMSDECDLSAGDKDYVTLSGDLETQTLTSDKVYELEGYVYVPDGETLTIEPCTRIEGLPAESDGNPGTLIVSRGGKLMAEGEADAPILFTSVLAEGEREAGTWGGVIILGKAPNFKGESVQIEGLAAGAANEYGGDVEDDNSGSLKYVRIEYGGAIIGTDNEINGLTLGSVGSGTTLSYIEVNTTLDDCFEFFGGTVDADHLVCNNQGDDMFDVDQGYKGKLSFLFGRASSDRSSDPNGFEMDSDKASTDEPRTTIEVENATLCGTGMPAAMGTTRGMVLRENLQGSIDEIAITGFEYGVDARDEFGTPEDPSVTLANASFWGQAEEDVQADETGDADNDNGFSEVDWFDADSSNTIPDSPAYDVDDCQGDDGPNAAVLDSGIGAFVDGGDWLQGMWLDWVIK